MQRCLKLLALARCRGFLLPRAPRITPPKLRESAGDDFLLDLFAEADERVVDDTPDRPPRNYDAAPYAEHDYERAQDDDGASVDVAAVDALLAESVQMKRRRLFDEADAIRDELQRVHGVSVWDRERVWRTGRGGGRNQRQRGPPRSSPACGHDYECGNSDSSQSGMSVDEIDALLAEGCNASSGGTSSGPTRCRRSCSARGVKIKFQPPAHLHAIDLRRLDGVVARSTRRRPRKRRRLVSTQMGRNAKADDGGNAGTRRQAGPSDVHDGS